jgi:hypothetical protein
MRNKDVRQRNRANVRLAIVLGLVAVGFFIIGLYLAMGKPIF